MAKRVGRRKQGTTLRSLLLEQIEVRMDEGEGRCPRCGKRGGGEKALTSGA